MARSGIRPTYSSRGGRMPRGPIGPSLSGIPSCTVPATWPVPLNGTLRYLTVPLVCPGTRYLTVPYGTFSIR